MTFLFKEPIQQLINDGMILYDGDLDETKGLSVKSGFCCVNLSAKQWKNMETSLLIKELSKTITHELCHVLIGNDTGDGEEHICQVMADQLPEISFLDKTKDLNTRTHI